MKINRNCRSLFLILALVFTCSSAYSFTAVALIHSHSPDSIAAAWSQLTQKVADNQAIGMCREIAKDKGIGQLAKKCKVVLRAKFAGAGSMSCGVKG